MMALGIVEVLEQYQTIDQNALAHAFATNYRKNPARGYGGMAHRILQGISLGEDWRTLSSAAFNGMGSFGNGSAMRVAPLGAYFSDNLEHATEQARMSAEVTHAHPEGIAGAVAVAVAAAFVGACVNQQKPVPARDMLETVVEYTPYSDTQAGIQKALSLGLSGSVEQAVDSLGNGSRISAPDTVPFCLWCAARHLGNFEEALWTTVSGLGDRDTTCAIVGGIVILSTGIDGIPEKWLYSREPQEHWKS